MGFDPSKLRKRSLAGVIGLGKSGKAAAKLLAQKGFRVLASDSRPRAQVKLALGPLASKVAYEGGGHSDRLLKAAFIVKSPGLPPSLPVLKPQPNKGTPQWLSAT
jgi:UDP-N-acetylmuramoylalanine--D-glutamate ligase